MANIYIVLDKNDKVITADTAKYRIKEFLEEDNRGESLLIINKGEQSKQQVSRFLDSENESLTEDPE